MPALDKGCGLYGPEWRIAWQGRVCVDKRIEIKDRQSGNVTSHVVRQGTQNMVIAAHGGGQVHLVAAKADIAGMQRQGDDLVIHYADGTQVHLDSYFDCPPGDMPQLLLTDPATGGDWTADLDPRACVAPDDASTAALQWDWQPVAAVTGSSGISTGLLAGLDALVAGGGGGHDQGGSTTTTTTTPPPSNTTTPPPPPPSDTTPPSAPAIGSVTDDVGAATGPLARGATTDDSRPTLSGTAEAGSTVTIYDGGNKIGTVTADNSGNWSYTPGADLADGQHSFTITTTDPDDGATTQAISLTEASRVFWRLCSLTHAAISRGLQAA